MNIETLNILLLLFLVVEIMGGVAIYFAADRLFSILWPTHPNRLKKASKVKYVKVYDSRRDAQKAIDECPPEHRIPPQTLTEIKH